MVCSVLVDHKIQNLTLVSMIAVIKKYTLQDIYELHELAANWISCISFKNLPCKLLKT